MAAPAKLLKHPTIAAIVAVLAGCGGQGYAGTDNSTQPAAAATLEIEGALPDDERNNLSGAACENRARCLLIGDEMRYARLFSVEDGKLVIGGELWLLPDKDADGKEMKESDGEGVAFSDGVFYIVGSHSLSKKGKAQASLPLLRQAVRPDDVENAVAECDALSVAFLQDRKSVV